jgi:hypothetical protein
MIEEIKEAWGWIGIEPREIVGENAFGNLLIKDINGKYWRLCPEDVYCEVVANTDAEFEKLNKDEEFLLDWNMENLVNEARERLGSLNEGRKYCLKIPGILGGEYGGDNLATISFNELISFSGDLAKQIKDLPNGAQIQFKFVD